MKQRVNILKGSEYFSYPLYIHTNIHTYIRNIYMVDSNAKSPLHISYGKTPAWGVKWATPPAAHFATMIHPWSHEEKTRPGLLSHQVNMKKRSDSVLTCEDITLMVISANRPPPRPQPMHTLQFVTTVFSFWKRNVLILISSAVWKCTIKN